MNRFGFCKQEGPVFRIRDLNSPWRSVLHLDSVVKLKVCYNLFTYNEERAYGGTSKT